ncbi:MAG TPA: DUF2892 domain-containing protein [Bacteroidota bacterium]|nr:DUF2892 domain-containing protein [Bacteroidota bacterium]
MKLNMGSADRIIRLIVALALGVLYFTDQISGLAMIILGFFALIFVLTGFVGLCPLYLPFKFSTKKTANLA